MRAFPISRRISPRSPRAATPAQPTRSRWDRPSRYATLAVAAAIACSAGVAFAPDAGAAAPAPVQPENAAARAGILESVAAQPDPTVIPEDFVATAGYRPVVENGMLVNPNGDCSSPVPLPAEFDPACKSHDLGYDLIRYAAAHGQPLGPWARQVADAGLERRMHAACESRDNAVSRARCQFMASVATTAVDLNSIRQDYGNPIYEPFFEHSGNLPSPATLALSGIGLTVGLAIGATILVRCTRSHREITLPATGFAPSADAAVAL
ncbi:hypothetical protein GPX89_04050 [Nocardia sp. ET3-3]|uniref:Prokaryotic phospholipase A2 n=1 Tax=Nocardia terrae TaxID=2675851 RepID=A0A7K1UPZ7_9NOCA|nr:hypothetical protein [Nocardia terrae]MVU76415.1 hypothetical protein [Nocardia terrae]